MVPYTYVAMYLKYFQTATITTYKKPCINNFSSLFDPMKTVDLLINRKKTENKFNFKCQNMSINNSKCLKMLS